MAIRRYSRDPILGFGNRFGTSRAINIIRNGLKDGTIKSRASILSEGDRLDIVAGREYGDATLWWLIAVGSGIGWSLQVPPGTVLIIPDIQDAAKLMS